MDNEIKEYCKYCRFYGVLGCKSTLICNDGNRFFNPNIANEEQGMTLVYDDESGTWGEAPETYGSIAFDTKEAFEEALDILKNSKWISFKGKQPQDGGFYLTYYAEHIHISQWFPSKNWYNEHGGNVTDMVEYWKPLPEPPKE